MSSRKDSPQMMNREGQINTQLNRQNSQNSQISLGELTPDMGIARVTGFKTTGPLKDLLMSFGLIPGIEVTVEGRVPFSRSLILRMGLGRGSWRGVLRASEADIVNVTMEGNAE